MSTKCFVGNLNFRTTPDALGHLFAECGEVVSVNIISRGQFSLGYGFVEMKEAAAAAASVSQMDKKELDGRAINVELARPRVERPAGAPRPPPRYPPFRRGPRFPGSLLKFRVRSPSSRASSFPLSPSSSSLVPVAPAALVSLAAPCGVLVAPAASPTPMPLCPRPASSLPTFPSL
eukprot:GAFH01003529.1.p1 GENE.GAFH01003529.1~~GAFH01003529.1.p1  ORF type:complete len:176 (-),score=35.46 GAFH01003529.1:334-861(-)